MTVLRFTVAALVFGALLHALPATAQDAQRDSLIADASALFRNGSFGSSLRLFAEADQLRSSSVTLRGMALCELRLQRFGPAMAHAKLALADTREPLPSEKRSLTQQLVENIRDKVGGVQLRVEPRGARVSVDGSPALFDPDGVLWLSPGRHTVAIELDGYEPWGQTLGVSAGAPQPLAVRLRQAASGEPVPVEPMDAPTGPMVPFDRGQTDAGGDEGGGVPVAPIIVASLGGAALIAAAVTGSMYVSKDEEVDKKCANMDPCSLEFAALAQDADNLALATNILLGVGAAGVVIGVTWLVVASVGDDDGANASARIDLGPTHAGLVFEGRM
jgi:hypothetical protein